MRTIVVTRFGGPEVLELRERPDPVAGPGQVVVDVAAIPLLWLDTALRSGKGRDWFPVRPPYVPGSGVAGTVSTTGSGVDADWIGRRVLSNTRESGSYTERVAVPADGLVPIPDELTDLTAAALLTDGRTALGVLDGVAVEAGTPVLITGAAGGMGLLLVQLARARGARVVGAARGEAKLAAVRAQGADAAIDYSEPAWTERVLAALGGERPGVVLDGVGGEIGRAAFAITAEGGEFSAHGAASGEFTAPGEDAARERGIAVRRISEVQFSPEESDRRLREVLAQAAAGRVAPVIGRTYPLEDAAEAHRRIEAREVIGKSLLLVNGRGPGLSEFDQVPGN
jgi:NADPH2:quinone reductase